MSSEEKIIKSKLTIERYPFKSIIELVIDRLQTDSDKPCIVNCANDRKWSKQQVLDSSLNFAYYLINDCGLENGDIVCFVVNNSDIHAIAILGVLAAGALYCSLDEDSTEREIRDVVTNIKPVILVTSDWTFPLVKKISEEFSPMKILVIDMESKEFIMEETKQNNLESIEETFSRERKPGLILPRAAGIDDIATLVMSSGSTGRSKAIPRTNRNFLIEVVSMQHKELVPLNSEDVLSINYFCHRLGQDALFLAINGGALMAIMKNEQAYRTFFEIIHKYSVTIAFVVVPQLLYLAKNYKKYNRGYLSSLRDLEYGSAYMPEHIYNSLVEKFGFIKFRKGFAMSETGTVVSVYDSDWKKLSNVNTLGKLYPCVEAKIIDENGNSLGPNMRGQICFRGDHISPGYFNDDEETEKVFTSDHFFKTGDLGYYDENEFFYFVSRNREIIKVGGEVVVSAELETVLLENSEIENAAVIAIKDDRLIEVPLAFVTLKPGSNLTVDDIQEYVDCRVSDIKRLRGGVRFIDKFPLDSLNKIDKLEFKNLVVSSV